MNQQRFDKALKRHALWLSSHRRKGKCADLSRVRLNGVDMSWADLTLARLDGANLRGANARRACFLHADLVEANLIGADIDGAEFGGAVLVGAKIDFNIRNVAAFNGALVSKDQLPWLILHPHYKKFRPTLKIYDDVNDLIRINLI